jgi:hypothetical protein
MSTRMQQRRGTASQWTNANPVLAAGEIGVETDTNQFKLGDGTTEWSDLSYFKNLEDLGGSLDDYILLTQKAASNGVATLDSSGKIPLGQLGNLIAGAPEALDTLSEIAAALDNDGSFATTILNAVNAKVSKSGTQMTGNINMDNNKITNLPAPTGGQDAANKDYVNGVVTAHEADTTNVHGIGDTTVLAKWPDIETYITDFNARTTDVHGIANTGELATTASVNTLIDTHTEDTTGVHGILNTADLALKSYVDSAVSTHEADTTNVHGIADTTLLATKTYADGKVTTHNSATTSVHGIADTSVLATTTTVANAKSEAITAAGSAADTKVSTAVAALTKSSVGLGNVDNTSDANKPVSTATQTALNAKLALAGGTMTGALTLSGAPTSDLHAATKLYVDGIAAGINFHQAVKATTTTNLSANYSNGTSGLGATLTADTNRAFTTLDGVSSWSLGDRILVKDQTTATQNGIYTLTTLGSGSAAWVLTRAVDADNNPSGELATGDFCFVTSGTTNGAKGFILSTTGTITIGTTNVNYTQFNASEAITAGTNITKTGSTIAVADAPTFSGAVTASSGIVFSDGTQTKVGVPSITTIATAIASSATIAAGEADKFVPLTGAVQITLPATGYSTGQSIDFYQASGTGASFASTNSVVGTPGLKFRTTYSVATAMKISGGWLVFGDLSA